VEDFVLPEYVRICESQKLDDPENVTKWQLMNNPGVQTARNIRGEAACEEVEEVGGDNCRFRQYSGPFVEANKQEKGTWREGQVTGEYADGSFQIKYASGYIEERVRPESVRPCRPFHSPSAKKRYVHDALVSRSGESKYADESGNDLNSDSSNSFQGYTRTTTSPVSPWTMRNSEYMNGYVRRQKVEEKSNLEQRNKSVVAKNHTMPGKFDIHGPQYLGSTEDTTERAMKAVGVQIGAKILALNVNTNSWEEAVVAGIESVSEVRVMYESNKTERILSLDEIHVLKATQRTGGAANAPNRVGGMFERGDEVLANYTGLEINRCIGF
jgi:hypothetical protein